MNKRITLSALVALILFSSTSKAVTIEPNPMHNYALLGLALASVAIKEKCDKPCKGDLLALSPQLIALGHMGYRGYVTDAVKKLRWKSLKNDNKRFGTLLSSGSTLLFAGATLYKVWELTQPKSTTPPSSRRGSAAGLDGAGMDQGHGCSGGCCGH